MAGGQGDRSRENHSQVLGVLVREWDPMGVAGTPDAEAHYSSYGAAAYAMLREEKAGAIAIGAYLFGIATLQLGVLATSDLAGRCAGAAAALTELGALFDLQ